MKNKVLTRETSAAVLFTALRLARGYRWLVNATVECTVCIRLFGCSKGDIRTTTYYRNLWIVEVAAQRAGGFPCL